MTVGFLTLLLLSLAFGDDTLENDPYEGMPDYIVLGGLFPITGSSVGAARASAARWAVENINKLLPEDEHFPVPLYIVNVDTQNTQVGGLFGALNLNANYSDRLFGYVGEGNSAISQIVQTVAVAFNKCQISYSSTSSQLSQKSVYPNFARVVASDASQASAAVALIKNYRWRKVGAIYTKDSYGIDGYGVFNQKCAFEGIDTEQASIAPNDGVNVTNALLYLKGTGVKIIFVHMTTKFAKIVIRQAAELDMIGPDKGYVWIFSDGSAQSNIFYSNYSSGVYDPDIPRLLQGNIGTNPGGGNGSLYEQFRECWLQLDPQEYPGAGTEPNLFVPYTVDAVLAYAKTFQRMIKNKSLFTNTSGSTIWNEVIQTVFAGLTGNVSFDESGDRIENYVFVNARYDPEDGSGDFVKFGTYDVANGDIEVSDNLIWPNSGPPPTDGIPAKSQTFLNYSLRTTFFVITCILMLATFLCIIITAFNAENPRIKAATFSFLIYILVAALLAYACVLLLYVQPVNDFTCVAPLWFGHTAFVIAFGCLFTKTLRVWYIFNRAKHITTKKIVIKNRHLLAVVVGFTVLLWVYLIVWTFLDPPHPDAFTIRKSSFIIACRNSAPWWYISLFIFEFLFLLAGVFLSFVTRKIELLQFNESTSIAVSIYVLIFLGFIFVPVSYFLILDSDTLFLIQCGGIIVSTTTVVFALFFPKFKSILTGNKITEEITVKEDTTSKIPDSIATQN